MVRETGVRLLILLLDERCETASVDVNCGRDPAEPIHLPRVQCAESTSQGAEDCLEVWTVIGFH